VAILGGVLCSLPLGYGPSVTTSGIELVRRYRDLIETGHSDEALEFLSEDFQFIAPDGNTLVYGEVKARWSGPVPDFDHLTLETVVARARSRR
jgi:hypothetical protein